MMKSGCLIALAMYFALVVGYRRWLGDRLDAPLGWIVPCVAALVTSGGVAAIWKSRQAGKNSRTVLKARDGLLLVDGRWSAVAGKITAMGRPINSPFRLVPCVVYEYEIDSRRTDSKGQVYRSIDFIGVAMTPCRVAGVNGVTRIVGMPDLGHIARQECYGAMPRRRARRWVKRTNCEDCKNAGILRGMGSRRRGLTNETDSFQYDWRKVDERECDWLRVDWTCGEDLSLAGESKALLEELAADDDEFSDDELDAKSDTAVPHSDREVDCADDQELTDDHALAGSADDDKQSDSSYWASLYEKCVPEGAEVVVLGRYDQMQGALVTSANNHVQIHFGDAATVADKLRTLKWRLLSGGLLLVVLANGALAGGMALYERAPKRKVENIQQLRDAVQNSDIEQAQQILDQGAPVDGATLTGHTLLMEAKDGAMAKLLIDYGANPAEFDQYGKTALMYAAEQNRTEVLKVLIAAGANVNFQNPKYGDTALVEAQESAKQDAVDLLLAAGADDDVATEKNGTAIDEGHSAFGVVRDYVAAIHAGDAKRTMSLYPRLSNLEIRPVDFIEWRSVRPLAPEIESAFVRGDDATVTVKGVTPGGYVATWVMQLRQNNEQWELVREHWRTP